jgi:DNA-3-methyladenine glycosylase II
VYSRLEEIAGGKLTPGKILSLSIKEIQKAGLAQSKATYILNLTEWFDANPNVAKRLSAMSNEQIIDTLTDIPGIGLWTVNVLLVFKLGRLDIAPSPDAVIRGIAQVVYGLKRLPSADFIRQKTGLWRPYRSIATMYLYQATKLKIAAADIRRGHPKIDEAGIRSGT